MVKQSESRDILIVPIGIMSGVHVHQDLRSCNARPNAQLAQRTQG